VYQGQYVLTCQCFSGQRVLRVLEIWQYTCYIFQSI
jgi:hypothetical protein